MRRAFIATFVAFIATGCAAPFVQPGTYDVGVTFVRDDWPGGYKPGETTAIVWEIHENDGLYKIRKEGSTIVYAGEVDREVLVLEYSSEFKSCGGQQSRIEITPTDPDNFEGNASTVVDFCGDNYIITVVEVSGERR